MKARIKKQQPIALLYALEQLPQQQALLECLRQEGVDCRPVLQEETERTVAALADTPSPAQYSGTPAAGPSLAVLGGISGSGLDRLLDRLHQTAPQLMLALITPHNRSWSFAHLLEELQREQAQLSGGRK